MQDPFKESYGEVLLFLKHQDDKINRVLTALAFLTAAGVALYLTRPRQATMSFENTYIPADAFFFGAFLIGLFFALAIALVALDPTSVVPSYLGKTSKSSGSILFFQHIGELEAAKWNELRRENPGAALANSFHGDARRLAHRAIHKVRRFGQATAFVQFAIVSLVLLGVSRLSPVHNKDYAASQHDRWRVITALLIAYMALPMIDFLYQHFLNFPGVGKDYVSRLEVASLKGQVVWVSVGLGLFFLPFFTVSTANLVTAPRNWQPVAFALFGTLLLRLFAHELHNRWLFGAAALALPVSEAVWLWWPI